jgi:hypothetical protein
MATEVETVTERLRGMLAETARITSPGALSTSCTISGCRAMTASNVRAGSSGVSRPCSQSRTVLTLSPNTRAKLAWVRPSLRRIGPTSIVRTVNLLDRQLDLPARPGDRFREALDQRFADGRLAALLCGSCMGK